MTNKSTITRVDCNYFTKNICNLYSPGQKFEPYDVLTTNRMNSTQSIGEENIYENIEEYRDEPREINNENAQGNGKDQFSEFNEDYPLQARSMSV